MATVDVNGIQLAYDEAGAGPPLIWVHGGFTDRRGADSLVPLLTRRYRVITYDRRGHSQSERLPGRQGVSDHVADLAALIEQLDAAPAHLLANSDGGEIASSSRCGVPSSSPACACTSRRCTGFWRATSRPSRRWRTCRPSSTV